MLKSIESKKEAEIYECLSRDESFIMSDLENLGPWHKYGSSIHKELQKISSQSITKSVSEHHQVSSRNIKSGRRFSQETLKQIRMPIPVIEPKSRTQLFRQFRDKPIDKSNDKCNVGFFVQCYPESRHRAINYQSSKEYFEKIALKMMYGIERKPVEQSFKQNNQSIIKKELKFQNSPNRTIVSNASLVPNKPIQKFINKKTVISFASQNQLLLQEYRKINQSQRIVSS